MYKIIPLAPFYTFASLGLIVLVWQNSPFLEWINNPSVLYFGVFSTVLSAFIALFRDRYFSVAYDFFCLGNLCIWFVHWREVYRIDAPLFSWFPIFLVFLVVLLNRQVVYQWERMDCLQLKMIRLILKVRFFHPLFLSLLVLLSVYFREYFIFYPMVVSLLLIRCSFAIVLQELGESS